MSASQVPVYTRREQDPRRDGLQIENGRRRRRGVCVYGEITGHDVR